MGATAGLQNAGVLSRSAYCLLSKVSGFRQLSFLLVALPFFAAMIVTNDVALLAFVPFTILTLSITDKKRHLRESSSFGRRRQYRRHGRHPLATPKIFLYTRRSKRPSCSFSSPCSFALATLFVLARSLPDFPQRKRPCVRFFWKRANSAKQGAAPFRPFSSLPCRSCPNPSLFGSFPITLLALLLFDRGIYRKIDYGLLATFLCFFVFSGNMSSIPFVQTTLGSAVNAAPFAVALAASQVISNVPAAVLLSEFTSNWPALLLGVDLGGLRNAYRFSRKLDSNEALSSHP